MFAIYDGIYHNRIPFVIYSRKLIHAVLGSNWLHVIWITKSGNIYGLYSIAF